MLFSPIVNLNLVRKSTSQTRVGGDGGELAFAQKHDELPALGGLEALVGARGAANLDAGGEGGLTSVVEAAVEEETDGSGDQDNR